MKEDPYHPCAWECVKQNEEKAGPGKISHHTASVNGNTVYFYGGLKGEDSVKDIYKFNVETNCWSCDTLKGEIAARDDHAIACQANGDFYVFGGFVDGSRTNETALITRDEGT